MFSEELLFNAEVEGGPFIDENPINEVIDVSMALKNGSNLSLSQIGHSLKASVDNTHKINNVDRLEGNETLFNELDNLCIALSDYVFTYLSQNSNLPIVIDIFFMKDDRAIQMLSAEVTSKGRTLSVYRKLFKDGELKDQIEKFLEELSYCIPKDRKVIIIIDAGFHCEWFKTIENLGWYWLCRVGLGKGLIFCHSNAWLSIEEFKPLIQDKTTNYGQVLLTKEQEYACRLVTTKRSHNGKMLKDSRVKSNSRSASGRYKTVGKPWILISNLPENEFKSTEIVDLYSKRMQIEQSFHGVTSLQFGLGGRYIHTKCIYRWGIKMLYAAIVQITYWVIGIIGHSQGMQKTFQANTIKDRKVFSYFTLGKLIIKHDRMNKLVLDDSMLSEVIKTELSRKW